MSNSNPTYAEQAQKLTQMVEDRFSRYGAHLSEKAIYSRQQKLAELIRHFAAGTGRKNYMEIRGEIVNSCPAR